MVRPRTNLWIDLVIALAALTLSWTGAVLWWILPPRTHQSLALWGLSRHGWGQIHAWVAASVVALVVLHVIVHWRWLWSTLRSPQASSPGVSLGRRALLGIVATAVAGALGAAAAATLSVERLSTGDTHVASPGGPNERSGIASLFAERCLRCHGQQRSAGGFRIDDFAGMLNRRQIVPGSPELSQLLEVVSGRYPNIPHAELHRLSPESVELVRRWILDGAPWLDSRLSDARHSP